MFSFVYRGSQDEEVIAEVLSTEIAHKSEEEQEQGGL